MDGREEDNENMIYDILKSYVTKNKINFYWNPRIGTHVLEPTVPVVPKTPKGVLGHNKDASPPRRGGESSWE